MTDLERVVEGLEDIRGYLTVNADVCKINAAIALLEAGKKECACGHPYICGAAERAERAALARNQGGGE